MDLTPQQINLYNPALRRQRVWLSLNSVAIAAGAFALLLFGLGFVLNGQANAQRDAAAALESRLVVARAEIAQLSAQMGENVASQAAARELNEAKQQLAMRQEVLAELRKGAGLDPLKGQSTLGFSDYLRGLARQTVNGLWLTGFSVGPGGDGMEVRGRMLAVDHLPEYIRRLNGEVSFKGRQFVSLNIARAGQAGQVVAGTPFSTFVLTAVPETKGDAGKKEGGP